jgi:Spy/CpxP family protein refolding chaperone
MTNRILALAVLSLSSVVGQDQPTNLIMPVVPQQWDQLKQYLVLSDAQVASLQQIRQNRIQQEQAIYTQMNEKQRQIYSLLQQGSNDAATIGRLMVESNNLSRQLPLKGDTYRTEVLAILTPGQKAKLPSLVEAMSLQAAAWQATELNMIDNPNIPDIRTLPVPLDSTSSIEPAIGQGVGVARNVR